MITIDQKPKHSSEEIKFGEDKYNQWEYDPLKVPSDGPLSKKIDPLKGVFFPLSGSTGGPLSYEQNPIKQSSGPLKYGNAEGESNSLPRTQTSTQ